VTDAAGNSSTTATSVTIVVDVTPPAVATGVTVSNDAGTAINSGGATNDTTPVISGSATAGSTVNIYNGTELLGTATVGDGGTWTFTPPRAWRRSAQHHCYRGRSCGQHQRADDSGYC
jgi:hypothetical protein